MYKKVINKRRRLNPTTNDATFDVDPSTNKGVAHGTNVAWWPIILPHMHGRLMRQYARQQTQ